MPVFAHSLDTRTQAVAMLRDGVPNAEVARTLSVPRGTVGWWWHEDRRRSGTSPGKHRSICPRCSPDELPLNLAAYSYLLGLYLGDGCFSAGAAMRKKGVFVLTIACTDTWPGLMDECEAVIQAVMPHNRVWRRARPGCHQVSCSSRHWPCLFPQHGPGRKHEREIMLEPWQQEIVDEFPEDFVRGLIHSDGCRVLNSAVRARNGKTTRYYYSRYHFTNENPHIRELFTDTLDKLGIEWRYNNPRKNISIARRESVRKLDSFVGPKY